MKIENISRVKDIVGTWNVKKMHGRSFTVNDMYRFVETMNYHTKQLISELQQTSPEYYETLFETATAAQTYASPGEEVEDPFLRERARTLVLDFGVNEADFYTGLFELAQNAITLTAGAKLIVDGVDRSKI